MIANRAIGFAPDDVPGVHAASRELHAGPGRLEVRHYLTEMLRALDRIADFCGLAGVTQRGDSYEQMVSRLHGEFGHQIGRADKAEAEASRLAAALAESRAECERLRAAGRRLYLALEGPVDPAESEIAAALGEMAAALGPGADPRAEALARLRERWAEVDREMRPAAPPAGEGGGE